MNELDTQIMAGQLLARGLTQTFEEEEADLLLFNTCSIRDLAERKVLGKLGKLGRQQRPERIIGITGCMANAKKESLFRKLPHVDFLLGTNNLHDLNAILDDILASGAQRMLTDEQFTQELDYHSAKRDDPHKAYVSIIRGCDKFCTYCVVPYTRGQEVSRAPASILEECRGLIDKGYKEITLLGQNVNSYGKDRPEWGVLFHDLLYQIDQLPGKKRVRFLTSHPVDITRALMEALRDLPSLCNFVHFPFQAGSDRILKKMHRIYTKEQYLEKVALLKELIPGIALGTDVIVGFPTETEEEFQETYALMEEVGFSTAFLYTYSPRKGTPAMRWADDVPEEVKQERLQRLLALHHRKVTECLQERVGEPLEVLVERRSGRDPRYLKGLSRCWKNVLFEGPDSLIGTLQEVTPHSFSQETLLGNLKHAI